LAIKTGIETLDNILKGGLKENSKILLISTPEIKNLQFLQHIIYNLLKKGVKIAYLTNNKKPSLLKNFFRRHDFDISKYERTKQFRIINAYDKVIGKTSIEELQEFLLKSIKKLPKNTFLIIDSISSFLDIYGTNKKTLKLIDNITKPIKLTSLSLFIKWPYKNKILSKIKSPFNCLIELKTIDKDIVLRNYFTVSKANWVKNLKKQLILYEFHPIGGVTEFIPKLIITGPYNAGKSTFTRAISTKSTSVDRLGTTIALDYGHLTYKGYSADVFGTPGQARFDPLLKNLGSKAMGIFLVVDPSKPETFKRAKEMIIRLQASFLPTVVVANKRDSKHSLSINQLRKKLGTPKSIPIVQCNALKKKGLNKVLDTFFKELGD